MRLARPKNLAMKMVAWPCTLTSSIHYSGRGEFAQARARDADGSK
jgi:hypothetical protein